MFLVADNADLTGAGLTPVELDRDSQSKNTAIQDSLKVGTSSAQAGDWAAVPLFATIAQKGGIQKWRPKHVLVGAHCPPCPDSDIKIEKSLDPGSRRRRSGQERIIFGSSIPTAMKDDAGRFWQDLLQAQRDLCRRLKFVPNLCQAYFVYSSAAEKAETDDVLIVNVSSFSEEASTARECPSREIDKSTIKVVECRASEAHALVTDIVKGRKAWRGNPV